MRACVAVREATPKEALASALKAQEMGATLVEIRFDAMSRPPQDLTPFKKVTIPKIATLRTKAQGGGSELPDKDRLRFFQRAVRAGFDLIDIEDDSPLLDLTWRDLRGAHIICSHHDLEGTPEVPAVLDQLITLSSKGDIAKAAYTIRSVHDLNSLMTAGRMFAETGKKSVLIGMGELGAVTRILSPRMASRFTFVSLEKGKETAPGQLDLATLKALGDDPVVTGLTGNPLGHSLSPQLHNHAFEALQIPGRYLLFPAADHELDDLLDVIVGLGIRGVNVTIPHKERIISSLNKVDPLAERVGAVNVVVNQGGKLLGKNTDVTGLANAFKAAGTPLKGRRCLIIGAGGAARACSVLFVDHGADLWITNRTLSRAQGLAKDFGGKAVSLEDAAEREFEVVVNATPVGMHGFAEGSPIDPKVFRPGQWAMDLVYNPIRTAFLSEAEARGAKIIPGMEMLIYQAMDAFEAWTGQRPSYEVMAAGVGKG